MQVKQPLLDVAEIDARLDMVETFFQDHQLRQSMQVRPSNTIR